MWLRGRGVLVVNDHLRIDRVRARQRRAVAFLLLLLAVAVVGACYLLGAGPSWNLYRDTRAARVTLENA